MVNIKIYRSVSEHVSNQYRAVDTLICIYVYKYIKCLLPLFTSSHKCGFVLIFVYVRISFYPSFYPPKFLTNAKTKLFIVVKNNI